MPKSKKRVALIEALPTLHPEEPIDAASLAAVLAADYPLLDPPLIIAILSDHDAETLHQHLDEIHDQLGVLEASLVPDLDDPTGESELENSTTDGEVEVLKLDGLNLDVGSGGGSVPGILKVSGINLGSTSSKKVGGSSSRSSGSGKSTEPTSVTDGEEADEMDLLKSLFPGCTSKTLRDALSTEHSLPAAIDFLLSVELIQDVAKQGFWPGEEGGLSEEETVPPSPILLASPRLDKLPLSLSTPSSPIQSATRSRKKDRRTIPLVDTLQRKPSSRRNSRPSSRASSPARSLMGKGNGLSAGPSPNAWDTISSLAVYLSELLPNHPISHYSAYLHSPKYRSAYAAIRACLASHPQKGVSDERAEGILNELYGQSLVDGGGMTKEESRAFQDDIRICSAAAGSDVATVMDLMDLLSEIRLWPSDDDDFDKYDEVAPSISLKPVIQPKPSNPAMTALNADRLLVRPTKETPKPPEEKVVVGSRPAPSAAAYHTAYDDFGTPHSSPRPSQIKIHPEHQIHPRNWRTVSHARQRPTRVLHPYATHIPSYARGTLPQNPNPGSLYHPQIGDASIDECLSRAAIERAKREDATRMAGRFFGNGKSSSSSKGAVAGHYALQAREAMSRAREWELKAARMVVDAQLERSGDTIDLHHLTISEATEVVLNVVTRWYEVQKVRLGGMEVGGGGGGEMKTHVPGRGLTVITGAGRHSAGQRGVLGPAVAGALEGAGWRVDKGETGRGYLVVRGRL